MDIVGRCGPLSDADIPSEDQYKFYFAFENSNCDDYITEKFFNPIRRGDMVPVVMGASKEAYNLYGPQVRTSLEYCVHLSLLQGSFIHVDDFSSAAELGQYLQYLDRNDTAYSQYFSWRGTGGRKYL